MMRYILTHYLNKETGFIEAGFWVENSHYKIVGIELGRNEKAFEYKSENWEYLYRITNNNRIDY